MGKGGRVAGAKGVLVETVGAEAGAITAGADAAGGAVTDNLLAQTTPVDNFKSIHKPRPKRGFFTGIEQYALACVTML
jgi:hypothetical protein